MKRVLAAGVVFAVGSVSSLARAQEPTKQECRDNYEQGQRLRQKGAYLAARKAFLVCGRDPCPTAFQAECVQWLAEVDQLTPSVVVELDHAYLNARIFVDGQALANAVAGHAVSIDPGEHVFHVEAPGFVAIERREVIVEGVKARALRFALVATTDHTEHPIKPVVQSAAAAPLWPPVVMTSLAVVAGAVWAVAGISGLVSYNQMAATCASSCMPSQREDVNTRWVITDVAAPITFVALGLATAFWIHWVVSRHHVPSAANFLSRGVSF